MKRRASATKSNGQYNAYDIEQLSYQERKKTEPVGQLVEIGEKFEIVHRFCSGFNVLDAAYFLTAGHCISKYGCYNFDYSSPVPNDKSVVNFGYEGTRYRYSGVGRNSACDYRVGCDNRMNDLRYVREGEFAFVRHIIAHGFCNEKALDYGVLKLDPSAASFGSLELSNEDIYSWKPVRLYHHPEGRPKKFSDGNIVNVLTYGFSHSAHTAGGSSGCPVIASDTSEVIGIHVQGNKDDQLSNVAISSREIVKNAYESDERWVSRYLNKFGFFANSISIVDIGSKDYPIMPYEKPGCSC